jgi:glycine dehydrogenase subunit 1
MPYILNTDSDIAMMLKKIGVTSLDALHSGLGPGVNINDNLDLPDGLSESQLKKEMEALASKNKPLKSFNSFLGAGCYEHYIPQALEYILSNSQFLTAYTPYQAECSQGALQAIYEYQSYICLLTAMEVTNSSLLDGASSAAEAVLMAARISKRNKILIAGCLHPEYRRTLQTYLSGHKFILEELPISGDGLVDIEQLKKCLDSTTACCLVQSPNFFGLIEDMPVIAGEVKSQGALMIMVTNPLSLALLKEPGTCGVDIVCGEGQPFGGRLNFGGPGFGFIASRREYMRHIPGRVVGKTTDSGGKPAYCLTLQAREQHIRREKAMSNICSNQSFNVIGAAIYLSLMGEKGLRQAALSCFNNIQYLYEGLSRVRGVSIPFSRRVFNEFLWRADDSAAIYKKLYEKKIICGYFLKEKVFEEENAFITCCGETKTKAEIDDLINAIAEALHG